MKQKIHNIIRYLFSGGIGFVLNIGLFWILINYTPMWYIAAAIISFIFSAYATYNLHKKVTYSSTSKTTVKSVTYYYLLNGANVVVNAILVFIFVEYVHVDKSISLVLSSLLISIYSYVIYKKFIYQ